MEEYPDFVFTCDSRLLRMGRKGRPRPVRADPASGSRRAACRSWAAGGSTGLQYSFGESFVRQGFYGQRYLREKFGVIATTGANVDSFGHNASIPQLLRRSGADSYVFLRPGPPGGRAQEPALLVGVGGRLARARLPDPERVPSPRRTTSPSISRRRSPCCRLTGEPGGDLLRRRQPRRRADEGEPRPDRTVERGATACRASSSARFAASSTARSPQRRRRPRAPRRTAAPLARLLHGAFGDQALEPARGERPPARGEVERDRGRPSASGRTRKTEAGAGLELLLFNQFHDTLAGTSIEPAYEDARDQIGHAVSLAANAYNAAVQTIARQIRDRAGRGVPARRRLQLAPLAAPRRCRDRVHLDARGRRMRRRRRRAGRCRCS